MSLSDRVIGMCARYESGIPVKLIADEYGVQNPAVWKALRRGGLLPAYGQKHTGGSGRPKGCGVPGYTVQRLKRSADHIAKREGKQPPVPERVFNRDPCTYCGVRGDVPCKHRPWV